MVFSFFLVFRFSSRFLFSRSFFPPGSLSSYRGFAPEPKRSKRGFLFHQSSRGAKRLVPDCFPDLTLCVPVRNDFLTAFGKAGCTPQKNVASIFLNWSRKQKLLRERIFFQGPIAEKRRRTAPCRNRKESDFERVEKIEISGGS